MGDTININIVGKLQYNFGNANSTTFIRLSTVFWTNRSVIILVWRWLENSHKN